MSVQSSRRSYRAFHPTPGGLLTSLTPYSECLERVQSVLVFFAASGRANGAVLAELESEVRATVSAARMALLSIDDVEKDLDQLAAKILPDGPASTASRMMRAWIVMASGGMSAEPPARVERDTSTPSDLR
jgi:hypothetical protein